MSLPTNKGAREPITSAHINAIAAAANAAESDLAVVKEAPLHFKDPRVTGADDNAKMQNWLNMAPATGGHLVLDAVVEAGNLSLSDRARLTISGAPGAIWRRKKLGTPDQNPFGVFSNLDDLVIRDLTFDANNVERYGPLSISGSSGVRIERNKAYDSNKQATWASYDHYWVVVQTSSDVHVNDNTVIDLEIVEANNNDRVEIARNISLRAGGTAAIIGAAVANGYYFRNYQVVDNIIVDPGKKGIAFQLETTGPDGNEFSGIVIARNQIFHRSLAVGGTSIFFGSQNIALSDGNTYRNINIDDNAILITSANGAFPALTFSEGAGPNTISNVNVRRNNLRGAPVGEWAMDLRRLREGVVEGNELWGMTYGLSIDTPQAVVIRHNRASAGAGTAFQISNTLGKNIIAENFDTQPGTPVKWAPATGSVTDLVNP